MKVSTGSLSWILLALLGLTSAILCIAPSSLGGWLPGALLRRHSLWSLARRLFLHLSRYSLCTETRHFGGCLCGGLADCIFRRVRGGGAHSGGDSSSRRRYRSHVYSRCFRRCTGWCCPANTRPIASLKPSSVSWGAAHVVKAVKMILVSGIVGGIAWGLGAHSGRGHLESASNKASCPDPAGGVFRYGGSLFCLAARDRVVYRLGYFRKAKVCSNRGQRGGVGGRGTSASHQ